MDDWDTVTKIGSKTRGGGGVRETVVRGKSALNAAARSGGIIATEKKFAYGNAAASKGGVDGQRASKVDRENDIIPPKKVTKVVGSHIVKARMEMNLTAKDLGRKVNLTPNDIAKYEDGSALFNQAKLQQLENILNVKLLGSNLGEPKTFASKKAGALKKADTPKKVDAPEKKETAGKKNSVEK